MCVWVCVFVHACVHACVMWGTVRECFWTYCLFQIDEKGKRGKPHKTDATNKQKHLHILLPPIAGAQVGICHMHIGLKYRREKYRDRKTERGREVRGRNTVWGGEPQREGEMHAVSPRNGTDAVAAGRHKGKRFYWLIDCFKSSKP